MQGIESRTEVNQKLPSIGKRLAIVRERAGFSQIPFAEALGVSQSAYKNYERGASPVPASVILQICEAFNVSPSWLIMGKGFMQSEFNGDLVESAFVAVERFAVAHDFDLPAEKKAKLARYVYEELTSGRSFGEDELSRLFNTAA